MLPNLLREKRGDDAEDESDAEKRNGDDEANVDSALSFSRVGFVLRFIVFVLYVRVLY